MKKHSRKARPEYEFTVHEMLGHNNASHPVDGVGIEIEVEPEPRQRGLPTINMGNWLVKNDGSLRGGGLEYIYAHPQEPQTTADNVAFLADSIRIVGAVPRWSNRCSVHVHVNFLHNTYRQVFTFLAMYGIVENIVLGYANPARLGNLFCLPFSEAKYLLSKLREAVITGNYRELRRDQLRYCACNVTALSKFGSLEFRALQGTLDPTVIQNWVDILVGIKRAASAYENPQDVITQLSARGPEQFLNSIFTPHQRALLNVNYNTLIDQMYDGVRLVQDFAYSSDWTSWTKSDKTEELKQEKQINLNELIRQQAQELMVWGGGPQLNPQEGERPFPEGQLLGNIGHRAQPPIRNINFGDDL